MACLLGILHHQRLGFLFYPSSHLVPYLRDKLFPRKMFASLYEERDVRLRMLAKLRRTYRRPMNPDFSLSDWTKNWGTLRGRSAMHAILTAPLHLVVIPKESDWMRNPTLVYSAVIRCVHCSLFPVRLR